MMDYIKAYLGLAKKDWEDEPTDIFGMIDFDVFTDIHHGSKYEDNPNAFKELKTLPPSPRLVLTGDIIDRSCCSLEDVIRLTEAMYELKKIHGPRYIMGNHERNGISFEPYLFLLPDGRVVGFTHYDLISDYDKWSKYRMKKPGSNWLGLLKTDILDDMDHLKAMRPLPKGFLDSAVKYCNHYGIDILIGGHFHVAKQRRYKKQGKQIILLPAHRKSKVWV